MTLLQTTGDSFPDAESHLVNKKLIQQPELDHICRVYSPRLEEFSSVQIEKSYFYCQDLRKIQNGRRKVLVNNADILLPSHVDTFAVELFHQRKWLLDVQV